MCVRWMKKYIGLCNNVKYSVGPNALVLQCWDIGGKCSHIRLAIGRHWWSKCEFPTLYSQGLSIATIGFEMETRHKQFSQRWCKSPYSFRIFYAICDSNRISFKWSPSLVIMPIFDHSMPHFGNSASNVVFNSLSPCRQLVYSVHVLLGVTTPK